VRNPSDFIRSLPTLADVMTNPNPRAAFMILLTSDFDVSVSPTGGRALKLSLTANLPVLQTNREKHQFQHASAHDTEATSFVEQLDTPGEHPYRGPVPFRWASGGYLPIFCIDGVRYCMLFLRDLKPVVGWNVANGASDSKDELWNVEQILDREPKEEILIINRATSPASCLRLESPGGLIQSVDCRHRALTSLGIQARIEMQPLIGQVERKAPDHIEVSAAWEPKRSPHITDKGFLIFNPEKGENGIEFIQVVEWEIREKIRDLVFYDAELHDDPDLNCGLALGAAIQQAVGLFPLDQLIREFQKPNPQPRPKYVYDRGTLLAAEVLDEWLAERPHSRQWCPVAWKVILRYIQHALRGGNCFVRNRNTWTITFNGRTSPLKHCLGLTYIAHLLKNPGEEFSCLGLTQLVRPPAARQGLAAKPAGQFREQDGYSHSAGQGSSPVLEPEVLHELKTREGQLEAELKQIQVDLDRARENDDLGALEHLEAELAVAYDALHSVREQLGKHCNVHGHSRHFPGDWQERARTAVGHAIARALKEIRTADVKLWEHLETHLVRGHSCHYASTAQTNWAL